MRAKLPGALRCRTARSIRVGLAIALVAATVGCTGGGTLFPHTYKLLPRADELATRSNRRAPIPRELQKQALEAYYVQPGDVLLLEVADLDADIRVPADQPVMPDGTIDLAEYGRIVVAGLTIEQVEGVVNAAIQNVEEDPELSPVNVRLTVAESAVYYVLGEVNAPGSYPLIGRETVLDGLMAAGGLSDAASDCDIILSRPTNPVSCRVVLPVCYDRIVQLGDTTTNYQLRPGDRIFVATRSVCEQLMFWRECNRCPDCCDRGCQTPITPTVSPFVGVTGPAPAQEVVPPTLPAPEGVEKGSADSQQPAPTVAGS